MAMSRSKQAGGVKIAIRLSAAATALHVAPASSRPHHSPPTVDAIQ
jgi:hypothetical protein